MLAVTETAAINGTTDVVEQIHERKCPLKRQKERGVPGIYLSSRR